MLNDTIAAIATSVGNSGISIIRVSGINAVDVVDRIFVNPKMKHILKSMESHTISYGFLLDGNEILDEVMVSYFKGPKSFTCEDTVEINCHGGIFVTNKILEIIITSGARLAEPGEFTKRAFLNGRIDLSQAEAVMDLISSESDYSLKASVSQLRGSVYDDIKIIRADIINEIAFIESALDDPEHYSLEGYSKELEYKIININSKIKELILSNDKGRIIKDGIRTAIVGKPNAGKSSLLNLLTGFDRAIVTDIEGTTRDIIEEKVNIGNINLILSDTAGIRNTDDPVEKIGVEKAFANINDADLVIFVIDSSRNLDENDYLIFNCIKEKNSIILLNKSDLSNLLSLSDIKEYTDSVIINTSFKNKDGINELYDTIKEMFNINSISLSNETIITSLRHKQSLIDANLSLDNVIESINNCMPEDFLTIDLMNAYISLGNIIGEEVSDDLVNEIFSKFCMGK